MKPARMSIIAVLIISLAAAGATRYWTDDLRTRGISDATVGGGSSFSAMNSYALALLLGGLRGPLVMFLWPSSEAQKTENDLETLDTKIEWIRLLQAEFDTVHIFQIWNKAYNISVKMSSIGNKYITILDALEYAHKVDRERPNNINIIAAIGGIYFDKLGGSAEKVEYTRRVRRDTLAHKTQQALRGNDTAWKRPDHEPVLDGQFNVLPQYLRPARKRLVDDKDPTVVYDGSELQFLAKYQPYPYGVSPLALAYNYYKRAQLLQLLGKQHHAQLSDLVIDSRPALCLKGWAEADWEQGRRLELEAIGKPAAPNAERNDIETLAENIPLSQKIEKPDALAEAIFEYDRAARLAHDADDEYAQHIDRFKMNYQLYESHRDGLRALAAMCQGDRDFLKLLSVAPDQKKSLTDACADEYRKSLQANQLVLLKYYIPDAIAQRVYPQGVTRFNLEEKDKLSPEQRGPLVDKVFSFIKANRLPLEGQDDINEYLGYLNRATARLKTLQAP